jgi:hypothetical protein
MTLLGLEKRMRALITEAAATRDSLNAAGATHYSLTAYEGGPSGYWTNEDNPEIDELYGKSVAMGASALDAWLFSSQNGYGYQCYLGFSSGTWWSSHTLPEAGGFRPHPGWLALKLRNRFAVGSEMVATVPNSQPTMDNDGEELPLIASYALRGDNSYSVFVISRKLDGEHDGVDFGPGLTPLSLRLPIDRVTNMTRYRLEAPDGSPADPRTNNRESLEVVIGSRTIDPALFSSDFVIDADTGGEAGGIPPGSINLFVFDTVVQPPGNDTPGEGGGDEGPGDGDGDGDDASGEDGDGGSSSGCFILATQMVK